MSTVGDVEVSHATCRSCGRRGDLLDAAYRDGRMWEKLTCGHWQKAPHPGEFVLSEGDRRFEVWGSFEYDPPDV